MILNFLGHLLARYLTRPSSGFTSPNSHSIFNLEKNLRPGDVILVEGNLRISTAIKYLTQSTWSHAAIYVGDTLKKKNSDGQALNLVEADFTCGVIAVPISKYSNFHIRICRPVGLSDADLDKVIQYVVSRLGNTYDLKNVFDLMRYLIPTPPVPTQCRRKLLAFGSGEPTKAICSTMISQAFQAIRYPILPSITKVEALHSVESESAKEILHIRHHSLFAPRDFDISPYFQIIKPAIENGFNYKALEWDESQKN